MSNCFEKFLSFFGENKTEISGDMIVRDFLSNKSFDEQFEFGLSVLRRFGVIQ